MPTVTKAVVHLQKILLFLCDPYNKELLEFNGNIEVLEQGRSHNLLHLTTVWSPALLFNW